MSEQSFQMTMEIDGSGVIVVRFHGVFDAEAWIRQRDAIRQRDYPDVDLGGRPIVCDMRDCLFPDADWASHFKRVYEAIGERHTGPFRRAIITDDDEGKRMAVKLFAELENVTQRRGVETRGFTDFDAGYGWASEPWVADGAPA